MRAAWHAIAGPVTETRAAAGPVDRHVTDVQADAATFVVDDKTPTASRPPRGRRAAITAATERAQAEQGDPEPAQGDGSGSRPARQGTVRHAGASFRERFRVAATGNGRAAAGGMLRSTTLSVLLVFALGGCHRHADTAEPAASDPLPAAPASPPPAAESPSAAAAPEVDCSSAAIESVLAGKATWTNEGQTCAEQLVARCERGDGDSCVDAGTIMVNGLGGEPKDPARALAIQTSACGKGTAPACLAAAVMHEHGIGTRRDSAAAATWLARACELGDERGCADQQRAPEKPAPLVADANLMVESIAADGLELRELACAVDGGMPLFGTLAIVATLAKQKRAIDRCAPKGQAFAVTWTFAGGKVKQPVARGGTPAANKCIASAVGRAAAPIEGRCGAVILAGDAAKAATTVEAVRAP